MKTTIQAANEVREAIAPLPDGYFVGIAGDGSDRIFVGNADLCFSIHKHQIEDDVHVNIALVLYPQLIMASPARGTA